MKLSARGTTTTTTGGYMHIIIPSGGGFASYRISITSLLASVNSAITALGVLITNLTTRVATLEDINSRKQFAGQVSNFQWAQPANSIITMFRFRCAGGNESISIGTTLGGSEIKTISLSDGELYEYQKTIDSVSGQTLYFTITGTVSAEIIYNTNTI